LFLLNEVEEPLDDGGEKTIEDVVLDAFAATGNENGKQYDCFT
jgi:hypothetical protein